LFSALLIANERTVVVAQYLRVALVVLTMPLVVTYLFAADTTVQTAPLKRGCDSAGRFRCRQHDTGDTPAGALL